jgi:hypothetical protein
MEMAEPETMLRACPNCDARYKVVRIEANPTDKFREIICKSRGGPLQAQFELPHILLLRSDGIDAPLRRRAEKMARKGVYGNHIPKLVCHTIVSRMVF